MFFDFFSSFYGVIIFAPKEENEEEHKNAAYILSNLYYSLLLGAK